MWHRCRFALALGAVVLVVLGGVAAQPGAAQGNSQGVRLTVVGIGTRDYAISRDFYEKTMGFPVAFSFGNAERPTAYFQMSRDTFLELQTVPDGAVPGFTHMHLLVDDVTAAVARLRKTGLGVAVPGTTTPLTVGDPGMAQASRLRNANILDPNGLRLELNEETQESLTRKAAEAWGNRGGGYRLTAVGVGVRNYGEAQSFIEKTMGFPAIFRFGSAERPTIFYQMSRDTFFELQTAADGVAPGFTHVHLLVDDLDATVARLRQAGLAPAGRNTTTPGTISEVGLAAGSNVRNANIFDPNGLRLELNEWSAESLPKKAADAWTDN